MLLTASTGRVPATAVLNAGGANKFCTADTALDFRRDPSFRVIGGAAFDHRNGDISRLGDSDDGSVVFEGIPDAGCYERRIESRWK